MERWSGRVALVTGASTGIGATICRELVKNGMTVVGCSRTDDRIRAIAEEKDVKKGPGKLIAIRCDLSKESDILALFNEIRSSFGRLDACINNAAQGTSSPLLTGETSEWKSMMDVNILGLCICTREAVKLMMENSIKEGQIIHMCSLAGHRYPTRPDSFNFYSGTKFMLKALTEGLRNELKGINSTIRVASISPGPVETENRTELWKNRLSEDAFEIFKAAKVLQAQDIADGVRYILSTPPHVEVHDILIRPV